MLILFFGVFIMLALAALATKDEAVEATQVEPVEAVEAVQVEPVEAVEAVQVEPVEAVEAVQVEPVEAVQAVKTEAQHITEELSLYGEVLEFLELVDGSSVRFPRSHQNLKTSEIRRIVEKRCLELKLQSAMNSGELPRDPDAHIHVATAEEKNRIREELLCAKNDRYNTLYECIYCVDCSHFGPFKPLPLCMKCPCCSEDPKGPLSFDWMKSGYRSAETCTCCPRCHDRFLTNSKNYEYRNRDGSIHDGLACFGRNGHTIVIFYTRSEFWSFKERAYERFKEDSAKCEACEAWTTVLGKTLGKLPY
jgi:hypothetical protein